MDPPTASPPRKRGDDIHEDVVDGNVDDLDDVSDDTHNDETDSDGL